MVFPSCHKSLKKRGQPPNVILIVSDDQGWTDAGFLGSTYYLTPALDALAADGITFTQGYANAPNCAPSRACLLTGLYGPRHGIYTVNSSARGKPEHRKLIPVENKTILDSSFVTIAEVMNDYGYATISVGKWHLGDETTPEIQGFDHNIGGYQLGHTKSHFSPYQNPALEDGPEGEYLTDRLTDEAIGFIRGHHDIPFFLYLPHYAVHTPIQGKDSLVAWYLQQTPGDHHNHPEYASMISSLDENIGRIIRELERLGLRENTLVIFLSDNGGHASYTSQYPLRGGKGMLYEGGIRVPFLFSWPGHIKSGIISDYPIIGTDVFPTILDLIGAAPPRNMVMDGVSLKELLLKEKTPDLRPLFWHFPAYLERYRGHPDVWRTTPVSAIRYGDWKLIEFFEDGTLELYNLRQDIGEHHNLIQEYPEKSLELVTILRNWQAETGAFIPTQSNPGFLQDSLDQARARIQESMSEDIYRP